MLKKTPLSVPSTAASSWLHKKHVLINFNLGYRRLDNWVSEGIVRSVKLGQGKQCRRLFNVCDLEHALQALSEGKEPARVCGRGAK